MIRRITIHNFMAHKDTVIEPAEGITVLVGPNNCGKSAVVEALQALGTNSGKDFMVRHGENDCQIIVETGEGNRIEWRRKSGTVSYLLNDHPVHRMRGAVPDGLDNLLKLPEVAGPDGKDYFAVHFGTQKEPIFLLDRSGRHTAAFFASSSDASRLVAMQAAHKKKVAARRTEEQRLEKQELQISRRLESLQPVSHLVDSLKTLEATHNDLRTEAAAIEGLEAAIHSLQRQARAVNRASEKVSVLIDLPTPPSLLDTRDLEKICGNLARQETEVKSQAAKTNCLSPLMSPPVFDRTEHLEEVCLRLRSQNSEVAYARSRVQAVLNIPAPATLRDPKALADAVNSLYHATAVVAAAKAKTSALFNIPVLEELDDLGPLARIVTGLCEVRGIVKKEAAHLKQAGASLNDTTLAIKKWAASHPICPTCGALIDQGRFLTKWGHGHG